MKETLLLNNKINYYETDKFDSNKKNIFFCHGFGSSFKSFVSIMTKLNDDYNCYAIDYPGHGESEGSLKEMKIRFFIRTIKEFLKSKKIDKVTLVGHSMGGGIVSYLEREIFVDKVILIAPANPANFGMEKDLIKKIRPLVAVEYKKALKNSINRVRKSNKEDINNDNHQIDTELIMQVNKRGDLEVVNDMLLDELISKSEKEIKETVKKHAYMAAVAKQMVSRKNQNDVLWNYAYFKKKTLIIFGLNDKVVPPKKSILILRKLIDNAIIKVLPGCGHFPHSEMVDETYKIILGFLKT